MFYKIEPRRFNFELFYNSPCLVFPELGFFRKTTWSYRYSDVPGIRQPFLFQNAILLLLDANGRETFRKVKKLKVDFLLWEKAYFETSPFDRKENNLESVKCRLPF